MQITKDVEASETSPYPEKIFGGGGSTPFFPKISPKTPKKNFRQNKFSDCGGGAEAPPLDTGMDAGILPICELLNAWMLFERKFEQKIINVYFQ